MKYTAIALLVLLFSCHSANKMAAGTANTNPPCINGMIKKLAEAPKQNPPISIYKYTFRRQTVYYVTAPCCDQYSDLYDSTCNLLGHPDGGFTGKGDRMFPDFDSAKTGRQLIWQDTRN